MGEHAGEAEDPSQALAGSPQDKIQYSGLQAGWETATSRATLQQERKMARPVRGTRWHGGRPTLRFERYDWPGLWHTCLSRNQGSKPSPWRNESETQNRPAALAITVLTGTVAWSALSSDKESRARDLDAAVSERLVWVCLYIQRTAITSVGVGCADDRSGAGWRVCDDGVSDPFSGPRNESTRHNRNTFMATIQATFYAACSLQPVWP